MYAKDFLKKIDKAKNNKDSKLTEAMKGTLVGASIGAGIGLLIGFTRNKNLLFSAFVGSLIGGGISNVFITKK